MKKVLLMLVALIATTAAFAQKEATFTPVTDAKDLAGVHVAQCGDGSVYVSSPYTQAFTVGSVSVPAPEYGYSTAILKLDADGVAQWKVTLEGGPKVYTMTTEPNGTLYVAGTFMATECLVWDAKNAMYFLRNNGTVYSTFVLKISSGGELLAYQTFDPEVDETIGSAMGDPWGLGELEPLYQAWFPIEMIPNNIQVDADMVYVSATYTGDVKALGWEGGYNFNAGFGMYADATSAGVFSMNKSDLSDAKNVAYVKCTGDVTDYLYGVDAFNFFAYKGMVGVVFFGYGNLTLTTPDGTKNFTGWEYATDETGNKEHPMVFALVQSPMGLVSKEFHAASHSNEYSGNYKILRPVMQDETVYVGGSFYGNFPLNTSVTNNDQTPFVAAFNMTSLIAGSALWTWTPAEQIGSIDPIVMAVAGEEIQACSDKGIITLNSATGEPKGTEEMVITDGDVWNDTYAVVAVVDGTEVMVMYKDMNGGDDEDGNFGHWTKGIKPVGEGDNEKLDGKLHTAVTLDGDVYASMPYNQPVTFAGKSLPDTEGMTCALIGKYNNEGQEKWAVSLLGSATVTAMTTDIDNNLYAVGTYTDDLNVVDAVDGSTLIKGSPTYTAAFVLKISPAGKLLAYKNIEATAPEGAEYWGDLKIVPNRVEVYGGKVYVGTTFLGDVADFGWKGSYVDYFGMALMDNKSAGIFALDKATLQTAEGVVTLQSTAAMIDPDGHGATPDAFSFCFDKDANLNVAFIGWGNLTLTYGADKTDFSFGFGEEGTGMREHGFVLCKLGSGISSKYLNAEMNDNEYPTYDICSMMAEDDKIYMAGTFFGNLWFNPSITVAKNTSFVVASAIKGYDLWYSTGSEDGESYGTAMNFEGGNLMVSTTEGTDLMDVNSWTIMEGKHQSATLADLAGIKSAVNGYIYRSGHKVYVSGRYKAEEAAKVATGIKQTEAPAKAKATGTRYNVAGQQVDAAYKGFYIQDGKKKYSK